MHFDRGNGQNYCNHRLCISMVSNLVNCKGRCGSSHICKTPSLLHFHRRQQCPLCYLLGEKLVKLRHRILLELKNHFLLENPFVLEVDLLELANPFVLEGPFFLLFPTMVDKSLVFENQSKPQYNLKTKIDHSTLIARTLPLSNSL